MHGATLASQAWHPATFPEQLRRLPRFTGQRTPRHRRRRGLRIAV